MQKTQEMQVPSLGREDPLEKSMVTHSSILAWRIPWSRLQNIGLQRVGHDWSDLTHLVDLQYCVKFCCTAKWLHIYSTVIHIYNFFYSFSLWFLTEYWIQFPVLYSRTLLFIQSRYNSLHLLTPNFQSIHPQLPFPLATTSLFSMSVGLSISR